MATIIYLSNCTINPIIYGICNENLRHAFRIQGLFNQFCCKEGHSHETGSPTLAINKVDLKPTFVNTDVNGRFFGRSLSNNWLPKKFCNHSRLMAISSEPVNKTTPVAISTRTPDVILASTESVQNSK